METTLIKALNAHLRLPDETMKSFAAELKKLTPEDKAWLQERFKIEYGYTLGEETA